MPFVPPQLDLSAVPWSRRGAYMALLFWFNVEVWGRVIMTIIHW